MQRPPPEEFALKETTPNIAGSGKYMTGDKLTSTYDLVEQMQYLYVRVVKAKELPPKDITGSCDPYVEVKLGNYKGVTRHFDKKPNPEWDHVFAFSQDRIQASSVEIVVKDKNPVLDDFIGKVSLELYDVPKRVPPDSPLAPQWYRLEDKKEGKLKHGEIMLAVWQGTQADECFSDAWHSDAATVGREGVSKIRGKVYLSPKLWYVRVNVIECQDLIPSDKNKPLEVCVKVMLGGQWSKTKFSSVKTVNPSWNEDLVFVAAEPFEEALMFIVEDGGNKDEVLGKCLIPLSSVHPRWDNKAVQSKWHNLEKHVVVDGEKKEVNWNEQYTWEVYDPCTVITIGAFNNGFLHKPSNDSTIGKVRIRLSTLETERVYTHSYPLIELHPSGVKKMGELELAVRFSCTSYINMLHKYIQPILPKMHYVHPLSMGQTARLRYYATQIVSMRLARAEPPLGKEVVDYMLDVRAQFYSARKSKANFFRIVNVVSGFVGLITWLDMIRQWKNPLTTLLIHVLFVILILSPELILPTIFLYLFFVGIWRYRRKPRHPPHMDVRLSHADAVSPDELDEEFDMFPTSKGTNVVRMRYDRLRSIGGRIQTMAGDLATQGERFQSLLSWRDPRASALFVTFCLIAAIVLHVIPFQVVALLTMFYVLRHPKFRTKVPSIPANFFRRLPSGADAML
ncbi:hypothetical protein E3N88_13095 [Mikania micrantha]|uniref:C2 domain-containing protein n=1 Tax=Mikania micrantha TaxID=192012 RepID=A0A5N6PAB5_9ASTR|nr:hypothetical protein E3N88_13095 [Mikania micrantha]